MYCRRKHGEFVFSPREAKLRRLLREALDLSNITPGPYAADCQRVTKEEKEPEWSQAAFPGWRLGTWGAIKQALLADGLETEESMRVFFDTGEWSHHRCAPLMEHPAILEEIVCLLETN